MSHLARAREVFDVELAALKSVRALLDQSFDEAVELVVDTLRRRGKIIIVGIGKSGNIGRKIAATLTSTGSTSVVLNSVDALHGDLGIVNDGDLVIALSYSGESDELLNLVPALKRFSVKIIAITGAPKSSLGKYSDVTLNVKVPKEACPLISPLLPAPRPHSSWAMRWPWLCFRRADSSKRITPSTILPGPLAGRCC